MIGLNHHTKRISRNINSSGAKWHKPFFMLMPQNLVRQSETPKDQNQVVKVPKWQWWWRKRRHYVWANQVRIPGRTWFLQIRYADSIKLGVKLTLSKVPYSNNSSSCYPDSSQYHLNIISLSIVVYLRRKIYKTESGKGPIQKTSFLFPCLTWPLSECSGWRKLSFRW